MPRIMNLLRAEALINALEAWEHWYSVDSSEENRERARYLGLEALGRGGECPCGCKYPDNFRYPTADKAMSLRDFVDKYIKPHAAQIEREIRALYECPSCHSSDRAIRLSLGQAYHEGKDMCLDGWHFSKEWPSEEGNLDHQT
jgi:hypothetical protein